MKRTDEWRRKKVSRIGVPIWEWLGIWQTYRIEVEFGRKIGRAPGDGVARAEVWGQPPYRRIWMRFDRKFVDTATERELQHCILHETIHEAVFERFGAKVRVQYKDAEENAVDLIQRWLTRAKEGE